ncbi:MAG: sigma-70 family RNA polymerase sigma factor [Phycisphaerae bacterium]|nr:sigma-70 family RNA polymerase sigma factor [Phycisphaerae bacterium]
MSDQLDFQELTRRAQQGEKQALDRLAELAVTPLRVYVYRLTLQEDLTQEIVQETLLQMVKIIGKLQKTDRFLPWLYGIATNKLRHYYRSEATLRRASANRAEKEPQSSHHREGGLENLLSQELKEIITGAMAGLKTRYRAVLVMRCYDGMTYAEIADSMGTTEFGTRMLFIRAKKALEKQLSRNGLGKGTLLAALALFGKITAPSEAAASQIVVTTATANAGVLAGVATLATGKAALVAVTAGALSVGTVVLDPLGILPDPQNQGQAAIVSSFGAGNNSEDTIEKSWFYMPDGVNGPLIMRSESDTKHNTYKWVVVQDDESNYYYDGQDVHINNHRAWSEKTLRLATDSRAFARFLTKMDSLESPFEPVKVSGREVLVSAIEDEDGAAIHPVVEHRGSVLDEPFFLSDWPADADIVDHRDTMHKRGWTYFEITGQLQGRTVTGHGRIPFVYVAVENNRPYLTLRVGNLAVADTRGGASVSDKKTGQARRFPSGTFFQGLGRPWMGLHTLDCVRRDAAALRIPFETEISADQLSAQVTLAMRDLTLVYTVDLDDDLLTRIDMSQGDKSIGVLEFSYLQDLSNAGAMRTPSVSGGGGTLRRDVTGPVWLEHLARMTFFQD